MSTPQIHQLDSHVIDHIAAGEVVERPASVVKELLENAYDAGASLVQVELERGGLDRITITDDGHGMRPEDAKRCILRHATSKLREASDLFCIRTLGFRGEALSSIAAIAKVTITTRTKEAAEGFRLVIHGGKLISAQAAGCPQGTCIDVDALFYNTPARRKFMRAPATEQAHVIEAGLRVVLGAQRGGLVICSGSRRLLDIPEDEPQTGDVGQAELQRERVLCALGHRLGTLTPVLFEDSGVAVSGFVSGPQLSRSETRGLWIFVNGRFVRDRMLQRAVLESFQAHCPQGYPTAVLWLQLDPEAVDINVHPQKLEVRFADAHHVYRTVGAAVALSLGPPGAEPGLPLVQTDEGMRGWGAALSRPPKNPAPLFAQQKAAPAPGGAHARIAQATQRFLTPTSCGLRAGGGAPRPAPRSARVPFAAATQGPAPRSPRQASSASPHDFAQAWLPAMPAAGGAPDRALPPSRSFRHIRPLTSVQPGYLLGRLGDDIVLIDGLQATRRLVSEQLTAHFGQHEMPRHTLMLPPTFAAPRAWAERLRSTWEDWTMWGLELDCVGPDQYAVRAMPEALIGCDPVAVAQGCLDVVLRMRDMQDAAGLRRCVEARWMQLVAWTIDGTQDADSEQAAMAQLFAKLADARIDIDAVAFAKRLGGADFAPLLH